MPLDPQHGCWTPGSNGEANHIGNPLTAGQIRALPDGAEVVITWSGGNGPWPYRVLVDRYGTRRVETCYADPILSMDFPGHEQLTPGHRVTLGWDDKSRAWNDKKTRQPEHILAMWRQLRGEDQPVRS